MSRVIKDLSRKILELRPGALFSERGEDYDSIDWKDERKIPSYREVAAVKVPDLRYRELRAVNYPNIADQLDDIWHSMDSGEIPRSTDFYNKIKAVKDAYPKSK